MTVPQLRLSVIVFWPRRSGCHRSKFRSEHFGSPSGSIPFLYFMGLEYV